MEFAKPSSFRIRSGACLVAGGTFTGGIFFLQEDLCVITLSQSAELQAELLHRLLRLTLAVELVLAT